MRYNSQQRIVLRVLFSSGDWVNLYHLHKETLVAPGQIAALLLLMLDRKYCEVEGLRARITPLGRIWVLENRKQIFCKVHSEWRESSRPDKSTEIQPGSPYLPNLSYLDREFFARRA